jgi:hypothetical protein
MSGQLDYSYNHRAALDGAPEHAVNYDRLSFINPLSMQVSTLTVGGTATDGNYVFTATNPDGIAASVTVLRATTPATNTDLATAIKNAINASSSFIGIASATSAAAVVTVTFKRPLVYTLTTSAPAPGTLVAANTTAAGGSYIAVGRFVKKGTGDRDLTPVVTGTTIAQIVGVALRTGQIINGGEFGLVYDSYQPGDDVAVGRSERVWCKVFEAVTPTSTPYIWIDHTDTSVPVGALVAAANGGKAIDASTICRILTTTAAGGNALVEIFKGV